jgi:pterin-4a-carbinolamine dehydratase
MKNNTRSIRIPVGTPPPNGLKAERVQEAFAPTLPGIAPVDTRLKAERIQIALKDLPGWQLFKGARFIARTFDLGSVAATTRFLQYVADVGAASDVLPDLAVHAGSTVVLALPVLGGGWLETKYFELAQAFEVAA